MGRFWLWLRVMILDLRPFETFPARVLLQAESGALNIDYDGLHSVYNIKAELTAQKTGEEYYVQGEISASAKLECARCTEEFTQNVTGEAGFIFCAEESRKDDGDATDDEDYVFFEGSDPRGDISEIVRQALILGIGLMPLCASDCRGICPSCGKNMNNDTCDCNQGTIDERWEDLRKLSDR